MIINADSLLPHLKQKVRPTQSDASRHFICPDCGIRTKLNTLGDGRKKCSVCGKKFRVHKVTQDKKLQQCAEILLCFCLDFSTYRATQITHHRHRLVSVYYDHFRRLLTEKGLPQEKIKLLSPSQKAHAAGPHDASHCRWCKAKIHPGDAGVGIPVFGVQFRESGEVYIDPLKDDEAILYFQKFGAKDEAAGRQEGYAGFICHGKFHRFSKEQHGKDGAEQLWTWIRERVRNHHGIWKRNTGFYLKELEWKYNNRALDPEVQAVKIIELMPINFLSSWLQKPEEESTKKE